MESLNGGKPDPDRAEGEDAGEGGWSVYREEAEVDPYGDRESAPDGAGLFAPGDMAPDTGVYVLVDSAGQETNERTVRRGESFPPTEEAGQSYRLVSAFPDQK